jgi:branched-chain amino acid aminotransferase
MADFRSMTSIDGTVTPTHEACVPVMDRGFLYGDSIYEVFRTYDGVPLLYEEHWQRFLNSASLIRLDLQFAGDDVTAEIRKVVQASRAPEVPCDVYVRYIVTRGEGALGLMPDVSAPQRLVVIVMQVPTWNARFYDEGVVLAVARTRRNESSTLDPNIKGGNYLNNVLSVIEAQELGADDSLMLDSNGLVTEASNSNVFFVRNGIVLTPSQVAANLKGITKGAVAGLCRNAGIEILETELRLEDLLVAEECFVTSATREVMPVRRIDCGDGRKRDFPDGGGAMTRNLARAYKDFVAEYVAGNQDYSMFA